jgi:hypothetical protein
VIGKKCRTAPIFFLFFLLIAVAIPAFSATTPSSGTISPSSPSVSFSGGPFSTNNPIPAAEAHPACTELNCGVFTLTVAIPNSDFNSYRATVRVGWTNQGTTLTGGTESDFDVFIYAPDLTGTRASTAASLENPEVASFPVTNGTYTIYVEPFDVSPTVTFSANVTLSRVSSDRRWPNGMSNPAFPAGTPRFFNYHAPPGVAEDAGEPSIGVNWKTEKVFGGIGNGGTVTYFGGFLPYMLRVTFDDRTSPATTTWELPPLTVATAPRLYGDPILFTDSKTGRTFVSQEMGLTPLGSTMEWTDNDGDTFTPSEGSGAPSGIDHQTVGGGPFAAPIPTGVNENLYPHGVWYCSQSVADAVCSISLDGGITFGPAVPMFSIADCSGLHGHIKIGHDGTAYVPDRGCGGALPYHTGPNARQALIVSENNGITWSIRPVQMANSPITGSTRTDRDPSVAVSRDSKTVYFAYQAADGTSRVAVSKDKGLTWIRDADVGASMGVKNSLFHAAVAGDEDRAAVAFFGTETAGDNYAQPDFPGVWYLYIATTFDGGQTWTTQNVTPGDPVQRGGICGEGGCRNLLDFFDATIDKRGRVLVGYDDGCISDNCVAGTRSYGLIAENDFTAKAVIARQASGKRMFAEYDAEAGADVNPGPPPPPQPHPTSCDGNVASDASGDALHPLLGSAVARDQVDITGVKFAVNGTNLTTTITVKNLTTSPVTGTLGTFYYTTWTAARRNEDGSVATRTYATRVSIAATGAVTYTFGQYNQTDDAFVGTTTAVTGSIVTGPNGTLNVNVPLSLLGNPTIPVTDASTLAAVIEPYAVAILHEQAVRFVQPADRAPNAGNTGANWAVCLPPVVTVTCVEENNATIGYSGGWHRISDANASGGAFSMHGGNSPGHSASITVNVGAGKTGKITYHYATSTKGGSAELFLDGVSKGVISFAGAQGTSKAPVFGSKIEFGGLAAGSHTLELRNMSGTVYVDRFCLESSSSSGSPSSGPGATSTSSSNLGAAQEAVSQLTVPANATSISIIAESSVANAVRIVLVDPNGLSIATSTNEGGYAVLHQPVSRGGIYLIKTVNLSLGPVSVWTAATPTVTR